VVEPLTNGSFAGKVAIITGAAQGIGREIAVRLHSEGAAVWIADINGQGAAHTAGEIGADAPKRVGFCQVDVCRPESVASALAGCLQAFGRVDVLVNNAGLTGRGRAEEMDVELWRGILEVNLTGTFLCSRAAIPHMRSAGGGVILNVSSVSARMPGVGLSAYCCAKTAVETFTRVLAAEVAPYGIRVNAYAPGVTATAMTRDLIQKRGGEKLREIALRRFGEPRDIAELAAFLCSPRSAWITGTVIGIDGGTMVVGRPWEAWPQ
jgi:3-oxoacyl-[acyl-carrier protein] reductase